MELSDLFFILYTEENSKSEHALSFVHINVRYGVWYRFLFNTLNSRIEIRVRRYMDKKY